MAEEKLKNSKNLENKMSDLLPLTAISLQNNVARKFEP
jgi:hypothetical protein